MAASENAEQRTRMTRSLNRARAVQLGMLPDAPVLPELEIGVHYEACEELGGDFYDFIQVSPTELGIVLADVSGHGLDAALMMAAAKKTLQIHGRRNPSPADVLKIACEDLATDLPTGSFVTVWYGVVNLQTGLMRYASAGHNPFLRRSTEGGITSHSAKGVVLGAAFVQAMHNSLEEATLQLNPGDWLVMYTDGVSEAADDNDEQFGTDRLERSFSEAPTHNSTEILQALQMDVETFRAGREPDDDVTLLAVRFHGASEPELEPAWRPRIETNLPPRANSFIGREDEMMAIAAALEEGHPVISLIGVAGLGKTRLALEAAREVAAEYDGGAWFVALDNCNDSDSIASTIASSLQLSLPGGDAAAALATALELRGPTLIVLDNAESCVDELRELLDHWKDGSPEARALVTSQLHIGASDEHEVEIKPLATPGSDFRDGDLDTATDFPAVGLFVDRARKLKEKFAVSQDNLQAVLGICHELEGMPLAIELAASRIDQLTPEEIFKQLRTPTNKIAILRAKAGETALPYRSMREALEWSYAHLDEWEQAAFRQMCAFRGGFFLDAAEAVVKVPSDKENRGVLEAIDSLLHKSFLWRDSTPYGTRFNTYSSLRDFGTRLTQPGERDDFYARHIDYYLEYADTWNKQRMTSSVLEATERVALDSDNIRAAMRTAMNRNDWTKAVRLFDTLFHCRDQRGQSDVRPLIEEFLEHVDDLEPTQQVLIVQMKAMKELTGGNANQALTFAGRAVEIAEANNMLTALVSCLMVRGRSLGNLGREDDGLRDFQRAMDVASKEGLERNVGVALISIANIASRQDRTKDAESTYKQAIETLARVGDLHQRQVAMTNLTIFYIRLKRWEEAEALLEETAPFVASMNNREISAMQELGNARLLEGRQQPEEAIEHYMRALELFQESGHGINTAVTRIDMAMLCLSVGDVDAAREAAAKVKQFAAVSNTQLLTMRMNRLLGLIELEEGNFVKARNIFSENEVITSQRKEDALVLSNRLLFALAEFRLQHFEAASALVIDALPLAERADPPMSGAHYLALALRARVLQAQGKNANATRFASKAREIAQAEGFSSYSADYYARVGSELIDVPATPEEAVRLRVRCPRCGQKYQGSEGRIKSLTKCLKCGLKPFKPLKVQDGD